MFEKLSLANLPTSLFEVKEIGQITEVKRSVASLDGFSSCLYGQIVHFPHDIHGMVIEFDETRVMALVLGDETRLKSGDPVISKAESFRVPVGNGFIGRVVDAMGRPMDGGPRVEPDDLYAIFRVAPGVMARAPVTDQLLTGTATIDAITPVAKGQRQLIVGDRATGKTTLGVDAILNQRGKGTISIYCCIGRSQASLAKVLALFQARGVMDSTIAVSATAAAPPGEQFLAPYTACALGEYFMAHGRDVLVVFDDLTKHAWVHRQISLILERSPGREAYPGDMFYVHSQMMERAGRLRPELGGGTMTFLPIIETQQGDVTGHIPSNLISITDGQIYLSGSLFNEGFKPAVDPDLSVSRIGSKIQSEAMRELTRRLRLEYVQYREFLRQTRMKAGVSAETEAKLRKGTGLVQVLMQGAHAPVSLEEEIILFYTLRSEVPDLATLDVRGWKWLKAKLFPFFLGMRPAVITMIGENGYRLTPELKDQLDEGLQEFFKSRPAGDAA